MGAQRVIPLASMALTTLLGTPRGISERVHEVSPNAFRLAWERLRKLVGIENLHFHDLRYEAISRFFEMGLPVPDVALISGHSDPRMLFRYTHLRMEDVAEKIHTMQCNGEIDRGSSPWETPSQPDSKSFGSLRVKMRWRDGVVSLWEGLR